MPALPFPQILLVGPLIPRGECAIRLMAVSAGLAGRTNGRR
jgi:hypothetical protein